MIDYFTYYCYRLAIITVNPIERACTAFTYITFLNLLPLCAVIIRFLGAYSVIPLIALLILHLIYFRRLPRFYYKKNINRLRKKYDRQSKLHHFVGGLVTYFFMLPVLALIRGYLDIDQPLATSVNTRKDINVMRSLLNRAVGYLICT